MKTGKSYRSDHVTEEHIDQCVMTQAWRESISKILPQNANQAGNIAVILIKYSQEKKFA